MQMSKNVNNEDNMNPLLAFSNNMLHGRTMQQPTKKRLQTFELHFSELYISQDRLSFNMVDFLLLIGCCKLNAILSGNI